MINDQEDAQRKLRRQANQDAMAFLTEGLGREDAEGPKPPEILIEETVLEPVKLDFLGFGTQGSGTTPSGFGGPPPPPFGDSGACCDECDGTCEQTLEEDCEGDFQGVGTTCAEEGICPPQGACCVDDSCTIQSPDDCAGEYQGDCTLCDPNPCLVDCPCYFSAGGGTWLTKTVNFVGSVTDEDCSGNSDVTTEINIDPVTCDQTKTCSGGGHHSDVIGDFDYDWELDGFDGLCKLSIVNTTDCCYPFRCFEFTCPADGINSTADCASGPIDGFTESCSGSSDTGGATWDVTVDYSNPCNPV